MKTPDWLTRWKTAARALQVQTYALYLAYHHPGVPWYARAFTLLVVAYAFSPIDLIPDFIPVLGYLDDLVLIPAGVVLAIKMIPPEIMAACRALAEQEYHPDRPAFRVMAVIVILLWTAIIALLVYKLVARARES